MKTSILMVEVEHKTDEVLNVLMDDIKKINCVCAGERVKVTKVMRAVMSLTPPNGYTQ